MCATGKLHVALLDDLAALDPPQRRAVAKELPTLAETFRRGPRR
jgi:hypothetical protein